MADMTVSDLLKAGLRKAGAIETGETPDDFEMQDALVQLRVMLRQWSSKSAMIFKVDIITHALDGSTSYTIGSGADISTTRPVRINSAYVKNGGIDYPIKIIDSNRYSVISQKDLGYNYPQWLWYNPGYSQGTIYLFPPGSGTLTLHALVPLTDPTKLTDEIVLPGEYDQGIIWNLGCQMCPEYGKEPTPFMIGMAETAKDDIISINAALAQEVSTLEITETLIHRHIDEG